MPLVLADRVRETTTTTGTGTVTLGGAVTGFQTFAAIGNGNTTYYAIAGQGTNEWEVGIGTYTAAGTTLSRDTVLASSNGGALVSFSAGVKDVFCDYPAGRAVYLDTATNATLPGLTVNGTQVIETSSTSAALRITQTGSGNALLVEDSANPDSTPFVVDANGNVGVGVGSPGAALDVSGSSFVRNTRFGATTALVQRRANGTSSAPTIVANGDAQIVRSDFYDGSGYIPAGQISVEVDGTPGTNDMPGRLVFSTTADGASTPTEAMRIDSGQRIGFGGAAAAGQSLAVRKNVTGAATSWAVAAYPSVQSDVTSIAGMFYSQPATAASSFTLTNLYHFNATQGTFGAGSTVTNQYGFFVNSANTGATNNYGFYGNIAAGTGRWNFYANGTADNYFSGNVGIGNTVPAAALNVYRTGSTTTEVALWNEGTGGNYLVQSRWSATAGGSNLQFRKYRGTLASSTVVQNGDAIGSVEFFGYDGANIIEAAAIEAFVDGTPGTNDMPGRLVFSTTTDGASSPTERMRITSAGDVGIGTNSPGYKLDVSGTANATTVRASNGIVVNSATISANYTIASGDNGLSAGPVTVASGVAVTVSSGSVWTVV